ncbi:hypothetical protein D3OALGB2SA_3282 [Olavius algarvensis associated proteobacterium Delta 3]|nr:hypothetical protein D3OALGB2SA_3282 [Olavius algarvensis associated proteobacterium Delta 3]
MRKLSFFVYLIIPIGKIWYQKNISPVKKMNRDEVARKLKDMQDELRLLGVDAVFLFGSAVRDEAGAESDLDLLVDFSPDARIGLFSLTRLNRLLSERLQCKIDLATRDSLHPALKDRILSESVHVA